MNKLAEIHTLTDDGSISNPVLALFEKSATGLNPCLHWKPWSGFCLILLSVNADFLVKMCQSI